MRIEVSIGSDGSVGFSPGNIGSMASKLFANVGKVVVPPIIPLAVGQRGWQVIHDKSNTYLGENPTLPEQAQAIYRVILASLQDLETAEDIEKAVRTTYEETYGQIFDDARGIINLVIDAL